MNRQALGLAFGVLVFWLAYRQFTGSASFGELLTVGNGPFGELPPYDQINTKPYNNPSGLTDAEELAAINRYRFLAR